MSYLSIEWIRLGHGWYHNIAQELIENGFFRIMTEEDSMESWYYSTEYAEETGKPRPVFRFFLQSTEYIIQLVDAASLDSSSANSNPIHWRYGLLAGVGSEITVICGSRI